MEDNVQVCRACSAPLEFHSSRKSLPKMRCSKGVSMAVLEGCQRQRLRAKTSFCRERMVKNDKNK